MNNSFIEKESPEFRFITGTLKVLFSEEDSSFIRNIAENNKHSFRWEKLIEEAEVLDVIPFIYRAIIRSGIKAMIPRSLFLGTEKEYYSNLAHNLKILKESEEVARILKNEGIETFFLGGVSLLGNIYSDYGLRYIGDIDILIKYKDKKKVYELIAGTGYSPFQKYEGFFKKQNSHIDIKTDILSTDRISSRNLFFSLSDNFCYEESTSHPLVECSSVLSPARGLIACALHNFKHSFSRLMWSIDIAGIISLYGSEGFYKEVLALSEGNKVSLPLYYALKYVKDCNLAQIDSFILDTLKKGFRERWFGRKIYSMLTKGKGIEQFSEILMLQSEEKIYPRFKFLIESAFPRKKIMSEIYPKCPGFLIYTAYVARFFSMVFLFASMSLKMLRSFFRR